jgi:hypothetical protein
MRSILFKLLLFAGVVTLLEGCSISDDEGYCYNRFYMTALNVTGPSTIPVNTDAVFQVTFPIVNTCGEFVEFVQLTNTTNTPNAPREIAAAVDYNGCNCPEQDTQVTEPYTFRAATPGIYELHFLTEDEEEPIVRLITVTE